MTKKNSWFVVDKKGLAQLQEGKPKAFILRELIANAFDEKITKCEVILERRLKKINVIVIDDSPEGFKDLADSFTLFKATSKRIDPTKRGRFNLGEKQAFCRCTSAKIETTKGTIFFNKKGRYLGRTKRDKGSKITVSFNGTKEDFNKILLTIKNYLPPKNIKYLVNNEIIPYREPYKIANASLTTETLVNEVFRRTNRKTDIHIHKTNGDAWLFEIGIPVIKINCEYSIDIQQKIPLGVDRETVSEAFIQDVFAEVLNVTSNDIAKEDISATWIRQASRDERITDESVKNILDKRYGKKRLVFTSTDPIANDNAIADGYRLIHGNEMSKEEWKNVKVKAPIQSTTNKYPTSYGPHKTVEPNKNMQNFAEFCKMVMYKVYSISITVEFIKMLKKSSGPIAQYGDRTLTLYTGRLSKQFFQTKITKENIKLIIHELGHEFGLHTEKSYHNALIHLGAEIVQIALESPELFQKDGIIK